MTQRLAELNRWFETPLGQRLLIAEAATMQQILPPLFGYHLVQIGSVGQGCLLASSRIMHRCVLSDSQHTMADKPYSFVCAAADELPFAQDSLDVIVLPHSLEFADCPHEILREVERVLIPEGYVIILGFNPMSLWGLWRYSLSRRTIVPWCGKFLSVLRLKDWLALLGFEMMTQHTFFYALPVHHRRLSRYMAFLERIGLCLSGHLGAVYVVVAKKRLGTLTPIKPKWRTSPALTAGIVSTNRCEK